MFYFCYILLLILLEYLFTDCCRWWTEKINMPKLKVQSEKPVFCLLPIQYCLFVTFCSWSCWSVFLKRLLQVIIQVIKKRGVDCWKLSASTWKIKVSEGKVRKPSELRISGIIKFIRHGELWSCSLAIRDFHL